MNCDNVTVCKKMSYAQVLKKKQILFDKLNKNCLSLQQTISMISSIGILQCECFLDEVAIVCEQPRLSQILKTNVNNVVNGMCVRLWS